MRIAAGLDPVVLDDNEVLVQFGTRSSPAELIRDTDLRGVMRRVLAAVRDEPRTRAELVALAPERDREDVGRLLDELVVSGLLADASSDPITQYLGYAIDGAGALGDAKVTVLGAGPLGARVASSLAQHGIGHLNIADERVVDSLWRTFVPLGSQAVDGPAADAVAAVIAGHGTGKVESRHGDLNATGIEEALSGADLAVLAMEQPHPRIAHLVNRLRVRQRRPWLLTGLDGGFGRVGPLFAPPDTACYNDYERLLRSTVENPLMEKAYHRYLVGRGAVSFFPGLPAHVDVVAGYAALAVVHHLLGQPGFALGRVLTVDFMNLVVDVEDVLKLPRCPVCGADRGPYRPPFPTQFVTAQG